MKSLVAIIALFGIQCAAFAGYEMNRFELAKQAHMEKRFTKAIELLEKESKVQPNNAAVFFNLGLSYKAEKQYPKAIWAFEKTLKLSPKDSEAIELIEACYTEMDSKLRWQDETGTFQRALIALGSNFWAFLAFLLSLITAVSIIMAKRTKKNNNRKWYFGTAVFSGVTLFICIANASSSYNYEHNSDYAIALEEIKIARPNLPEAQTPVKYFPGAKVKVEKWYKDGSASINVNGKPVKIAKGLARI